MSNQDKIYCGSGVSKFDGDMVQASICLTDLPKEHMFEYNGKKYIKIKVCKKREVDQHGKTHYVEVDTWKPDQQNNGGNFKKGGEITNQSQNNYGEQEPPF